MPDHFRWLALVSLLAAAVRVTAAPGYLQAVGPPPLRFEPPPTIATAAVLPPLPAATPAPVLIVRNADLNSPSNSPSLAVAELPLTTAAVPAPLPDDPTLPVPLFEGISAPAAPGTSFDNESTGLQGLMKYFARRHGTNLSTGVSFHAPLGFVPPTPPTPSSSATFQTSPAAKP